LLRNAASARETSLYFYCLTWFKVAKNQPQGSRKYRNIYRKESREALKLMKKFTDHADETLKGIAKQVAAPLNTVQSLGRPDWKNVLPLVDYFL
jgi:hypothetical protein